MLASHAFVFESNYHPDNCLFLPDMPQPSSIAMSTGLIGLGALAWAYAGGPLVKKPDLAAPLNPMGINRSPYGEVFAMAMQTPISSNFDGIWASGRTAQSDSEPKASIAETEKPATTGIKNFESLLTTLESSLNVRTNPKPASPAHKLYLRSQVENKLRFAYNLDPSHYANYNSLHFFLTEPQLGTRPELTPSAAKLADETIQYCLKQEDDPRPALTAAAACTNVLHLMFTDRQNEKPIYTIAQMRQYLDLLNHSIDRYDKIAAQWDQSKQWDLISPQRVNECEERIYFIRNIRNAADKTIIRFEKESHSQHAAN